VRERDESFAPRKPHAVARRKHSQYAKALLDVVPAHEKEHELDESAEERGGHLNEGHSDPSGHEHGDDEARYDVTDSLSALEFLTT
jgi:hypothetical protein